MIEARRSEITAFIRNNTTKQHNLVFLYPTPLKSCPRGSSHVSNLAHQFPRHLAPFGQPERKREGTCRHARPTCGEGGVTSTKERCEQSKGMTRVYGCMGVFVVARATTGGGIRLEFRL